MRRSELSDCIKSVLKEAQIDQGMYKIKITFADTLGNEKILSWSLVSLGGKTTRSEDMRIKLSDVESEEGKVPYEAHIIPI